MSDNKFEVTIFNSIQEKIVYYSEAKDAETAARNACRMHTMSNEWMGLNNITIREIQVKPVA